LKGGDPVDKLNSEKLIERIEEAKDWLDKAKDEYSNSNPARGGLILNLAQAEVKHAWELSHHQFVSKDVQKPNRNRKFKYFIPVAASFVVLAGLAVGVRMGGMLLPTSEKSNPPRVAKAEIGQSKNLKAAGLIKSQPNPVLVTEKAAETNIPATRPSNQSNIKIPVIAKQSADIRTAMPLSSQNELAVTQNKNTLKVVSQLAIDEEALTKEASHSLRNGN
jgi:hypothetical protein